MKIVKVIPLITEANPPKSRNVVRRAFNYLTGHNKSQYKMDCFASEKPKVELKDPIRTMLEDIKSIREEISRKTGVPVERLSVAGRDLSKSSPKPLAELYPNREVAINEKTGTKIVRHYDESGKLKHIDVRSFC